MYKKFFLGVWWFHLVLVSILSIRDFCFNIFSKHTISNASVSDYLINFQGGFVRRGLFGEILFQLDKNFGINPRLIIGLVVACAFAFLIYFFVSKFKEKQLNYYILPLSIFLGLTFVVRKDNLLICLFIGLLYIFNKMKGAKKCICMSLVMILALNIHEAFFFICWPILTLLILREKELKVIGKALFVIVPLVMVAILSYYKGTKEIADTIYSSWIPYLTSSWTEQGPSLMIEAIGWSTQEAIIKHATLNFIDTSYGVMGAFVRPFTYIFIFYVLSNVLFTFRKEGTIDQQDRNNLSYLLFFQFFSLILLFTVLSCDLGRITCYWSLSSYATYLLIDKDKLSALFPDWFKKIADGFSNFLRKIIPPTQTVMLACLLIVSITPIWFDLKYAFFCSVIGSIFYVINLIV